MVASIAAAGIGALGSLAGSWLSNSLSAYQTKKLLNHEALLNYQYSKKSSLNNALWNRKSLEKAGYNPMLALGNMQGVNSNWSSPTSVNTPDMSNIGSNAVSNALAVKEQTNRNTIAEAQSENYNADSTLKKSQSITELYTQLEKINHADLMAAQKKLTDKDVSWYDKKQAREDLRVANEIERTGNDFKVGMANAIASQISANSQVVSSNANAYDIYSNKANEHQQQKVYNNWAKKHPYWSSIDQTLSRYLGSGVAAGAGYAAGKRAPVVKRLKKPIGFK